MILLWNQAHAALLYFLFGLEGVMTFLRSVDKYSIEVILRQFGATIGRNCDIESGLILHGARDDFSHLIVEDCCHIGKEVFLDLRAPIIVRRASTISMRVTVLTHLDLGRVQPLDDRYKPTAQPVEIGPGVYIGAGATILAGVRVGEHSIVGAGAVVNRSVPLHSVVAGVPARVIRMLTEKAGEDKFADDEELIAGRLRALGYIE